MKKSNRLISVFIYCLMAFVFILGFQVKLHAQDRSVSSWQFRHVPNDKIDEFIYVVMNYQNTNYQDSLVNLEKKYWKPFIKGAMDKGQTRQVAWGNAVVLAPRGENIKTTTVSFDLYKTLGDALLQT